MKSSLVFIALFSLFFSVGCGSKAKKEETQAKEATKKEMKKVDVQNDKAAPKATSQPAEKKMSAAPTPGEEFKSMTCTVDKDKRVVTVNKVEAGCAVVYEKFGDKKEVATARSGTEFCEKISERITGKLTDAGFKCM